MKRPPHGFWFAAIALLVIGCAKSEPPAYRPPSTREPPPRRPTDIAWDASDSVFADLDEGEHVYLCDADCKSLGLEPPVRICPRGTPYGDPMDLDAYGLALTGKKPTVYAKELWRRGIWVDRMFPPPDFCEKLDRPNRYSQCYLDRPIEDRKRRTLQLPRNWRQCLVLRDRAVEKVRQAEAPMDEELHP
jgi:hypothetical protein